MPGFKQVLAHGSSADFEEFDLSFCRRHSMGRGFYFTSDIAMALVYSGGADPIIARITMDNPYEIGGTEVPSADVMEWAKVFKFPDAREQLIAAGYDGAVFREGDFIEAVAFHPGQIESLGRHPSFEEAVQGKEMIP